MQLSQIVPISGFISLAFVVVLVLARKRLGELKTASWLVIWGAVILLTEHPQFAIAYAAQIIHPEAQAFVFFNTHARIHFFMSGVYALIGLVLLGVIGYTLLREGRQAGWYALLFALIVGGSLDLIMGGLWYQHGSPIYRGFGVEHSDGFGWQFLYVYLIAWIAALVISFRSIFTNPSD